MSSNLRAHAPVPGDEGARPRHARWGNSLSGARSEEWSYDRFAEALLSTEIPSRDASGGALRIRAARFPAPETLEEFDFTFQRSIKKQVIDHVGQLDFLDARENVDPARAAANLMLGARSLGTTLAPRRCATASSTTPRSSR